MTALFLFGTLLDPDLRRIVIGTDGAGLPATLDGHRVERAEDGDWPLLVPHEGARADGLLFTLDDQQADRARFYEAAFGYIPAPCRALGETGPVPATLYRAPDGRGSGETWALPRWQHSHGEMTRIAAQEIMSLFGQVDPDTLRIRVPTIRVRAAAAVRARAQALPCTLRSAMHRDRVQVIAHRQPYSHFFAMGETNLTHPTFTGGQSAPMERSGLHAADAVSVLPFDPVRRRVLLVEQFRYGAWLRGDPHPWQLEPPAGRIDPGETAEEAARREALEEAHVTLGRLHRVAGYYPAPGSITEFVDSFVGIADLPDTSPGHAGLSHEQEDIRFHVLSLDAALDLVETGEAATGPLILTLLWLDRALRRGDPL